MEVEERRVDDRTWGSDAFATSTPSCCSIARSRRRVAHSQLWTMPGSRFRKRFTAASSTWYKLKLLIAEPLAESSNCVHLHWSGSRHETFLFNVF